MLQNSEVNRLPCWTSLSWVAATKQFYVLFVIRPWILLVQALKCYSRALELDPSMLVALNNRAMVHLKLGSAAEAEQDCILVLESQPANVKALLRRAAARCAILCQPDFIEVAKLPESHPPLEC